MQSTRTMAAMLVIGLAITTWYQPVSLARPDRGDDHDRSSVIARSKVWMPTDIPSMDLRTGPTGPGSFAPDETVTCDYVPRELAGDTPKFACRISQGDEVKVKYGRTNGEVYGEVLATRLLWALGFGADRMYSVRLVCRGCPQEVGGTLQANGERVLDPVAIERKIGEELYDSWRWQELDSIAESREGATRAQRDALTLLAVFMQHSDSKSKNQRIVCMDEPPPQKKQPCQTPMMIMQDVGITFGRANTFNSQEGASVNLVRWREVPVWKDSGRCIGKMSGSFTGTLEDPAISEEGRAFLAGLLAQLSNEQLTGMFEAARVTLRPRDPDEAQSGFPTVQEWVKAFRDKQAQITHHRCS